MNPIVLDLMLAAVLLASLLVALEFGYRMGKRVVPSTDPRAGGQVGAIQGAVLGLLGLLLGFSFAAAGARFLERQDLIVAEANSIGTAYLRADLLDPPHRAELKDALKEYVAFRLSLASTIRSGLTPEHHEQFARGHARIWNAAIEGVRARESAMLGVLPPVNDVIDTHSLRLAAGKKHLPLLIMSLLVACSIMATSVIGYGSGLGGHRRAPLTMSLAFLIATALWITIDLDHPRAGLLQLSDAPLKALSFE